MHVLLAHPGTQHALRLASELSARDLLGEFWTGIAMSESGAAAWCATALKGLGPFRALSNRIARGIPATALRRLPANELRALFQLRRGRDPLLTLHERNDRFQQAIAESSIRKHEAVIGFDTSSWRLAERTVSMGLPFFLDRTIAHPAALAELAAEMHQRYPAWCPPPAPRPPWLVAAEADEHRLARRIVVGGSFARDTLLAQDIPPEKIIVNPYGVDWNRFSRLEPSSEPRPLRFLFLGSHIARKGLPILLEAWSALGARRGDAELWLAGPCGTHERSLIPELPGLEIKGMVPHAGVPALMAQTDVLVLPSLFEGFGLVLLEALAAGLPFISTAHTGAADLPDDGRLGRKVDVGSVGALEAAMADYLRHPPDRATVMTAAQIIRDEFSWATYGNRWAHLLSATV